MKVLYIAAECKPFAKAGGVGDVTGELPSALKKQGIDIEIVMPWYGKMMFADTDLTYHGISERVGTVRTVLDDVPVTFIKNPTYFENDYSGGKKPPFASDYLFKRDYSTPYVDSDPHPFADDALRFAFFSKACLDIIERKRPDIVHINDWVLGYLFGWMHLRHLSPHRILTIHNIGYQGNLWRELINNWDINELAAHPELGPLFTDPSYWASVNPLRLAMELADRVNTVSPTYQKEATQASAPERYFEGGKGLEGVAARLATAGTFHGILNGFDYAFTPTAQRFDEVLARKATTKAALSQRFPNPNNVLLGFVGRAVEQKFKLLAEQLDGKSVLEHILEIDGVNVAIVATGQPMYEQFLRGLQARPNLDVTIAFDRTKAQQLSLGSDVFLMPSLYEPCGITQIESLSCGTPPLVRWTGGLVDTVRPHTDAKHGTGFGFDGTTKREVLANLVNAVREAVQVYSQTPAIFRMLQQRGFYERFLWKDAAARYITDLYEPVMS